MMTHRPSASEESTVLRDLHAEYLSHNRSLTNLALWTVAVYRYGVWANGVESGSLRAIASKIYGALSFGVELATGCTVAREAHIGKALHLVHAGNIHIHPDAVIGDRVGIMHDVTIGTNMDRGGVPRIGSDVFIGAGAKILGPVAVGDGARVAANSVVLSDVPAGATAIGIPARVLIYTGRSDPATLARKLD